MVTIPSLWLPILLSAVIVFVVSSIIHMVLRYHRTDFGKVPSEDAVMEALRPFEIPPGEYAMPFGSSPADMKDAAFLEKRNKGPVALLTVVPSGPPSMGRELVQWFIYLILVGIFAAYIAGRAWQPDHEYWDIFRFAGAAAFGGYALALMQNSVWYARKWSSTLKSMFDGLIYAVLTGGTFAGLWPG